MLNPNISKKISRIAGLTLMELVVVISIFGIFSGIAIFNYSDFKSGVTAFNLTQDIGLFIKQAQNSAILGQYPRGNQYVMVDDFANWKPKYGVYFNTNSDDRFWYFFDNNEDNMFLNGNNAVPGGGNCETVGTECLDEVLITTREKIFAICEGYDCSLNQVALMFERPFPDLIATNNGGQNFVSPEEFDESITIIVEGSQNNQPTYRGVTVTPLGQISVDFVDLDDFGLQAGNGNGPTEDGAGNEL